MTQLAFVCPQDSSRMPKTESGRHCELCAKNIVDFTEMTPEEIQQTLEKEKETTCGIFKREQVHSPRKSQVSTLFKLAFGFVFLLGMNATDVVAQTDTLAQTTQPGQLIIHGNVFADGEPLIFARICVLSGDRFVSGAITDFDGNYTLTVKPEDVCENLRIEVKYPGYQSVSEFLRPIESDTLQVNLSTTASDEEFLTGLIIIVNDPPLISRDPYDFGKTTFTGEDIRLRQP